MHLVTCPGMQMFSPSLHMPLNLPHSIVFPVLSNLTLGFYFFQEAFPARHH